MQNGNFSNFTFWETLILEIRNRFSKASLKLVKYIIHFLRLR